MSVKPAFNNQIDSFSPDYVTARERFRDEAAQLGWEFETLPIGAKGAYGEELTVDVAQSTNDARSGTLILSSALHGIEGFFGSAVQFAAMQKWRVTPPDVRVVVIHALNPYGFSWLRRADENNVDLNRNFLLPGEPYSGTNDLYRRIDTFLNPRKPPSRWEPFVLHALWHVIRHSKAALRQAIAEGQYDYPKGLFYGGSRPSQLHQILSEGMPRWLSSCQRAIHLDLHTGLGRSGTYTLLVDAQASAAKWKRLVSDFREGTLERSEPGGVAYRVRGDIGGWCAAQAWCETYDYLCVEFGTYGPRSVLKGLRAENQAHHWGKPVAESTQWAKSRLKELLCPASPKWRQRVIASSLAVIDEAVAGLLRDRSESSRRRVL